MGKLLYCPSKARYVILVGNEAEMQGSDISNQGYRLDGCNLNRRCSLYQADFKFHMNISIPPQFICHNQVPFCIN